MNSLGWIIMLLGFVWGGVFEWVRNRPARLEQSTAHLAMLKTLGQFSIILFGFIIQSRPLLLSLPAQALLCLVIVFCLCIALIKG